MRHLQAGAALALLGSVCLVHACPLAPADGTRMAEGAVQLAWRAEPAPIVAGQSFVLWITACPASARLLAVDATMPEHRHGMNYRVKLTPQGAGRWRAEGLLWHMSGRWELRFDVEQAGSTHSLRHAVNLP